MRSFEKPFNDTPQLLTVLKIMAVAVVHWVSPSGVAGKRLSNRFCVHPMEGWDANEDGSPSDYTLRRWCRFGESGAELIWGGEAYAVQEDGRANPNQLFMNPAGDNEAWLGALMRQLKRGAAAIGKDPDTLVTGLQLTHSGRFSRPDAKGPKPRILHHHPQLARKYNLDPCSAIDHRW